MIISIIDIGTQTIKHNIFSVDNSGDKKLIYNKRFSDSDLGGKEIISVDSIERSLKILEKCNEVNKLENVEKQHIIGTDVFRKALNIDDFLSPAKKLLGQEIHIISHEDEALYLYKGFLPVISTDSDFTCTNIGGGSVEVVVGNINEVKSLEKIPFGVKLLSNNFRIEDHTDWQGMEEYLSNNISVKEKAPAIFVTGVVLNFMTTLRPHLNYNFEDNEILQHPIKLSIKEYEKFVKDLQKMPISTLKELYFKDPKYCDGVAIGHTVYLEVAKKSGAEWVIPSNNELTDGILYELFQNQK
ncbi:MAG: hypothetical protein WC241_00480 [Candidatus Paceibacterota bacterium]|jgi:exopolyphosphatase/guanosine-5'-triphosphate,3'-diphosphate pyrophosphatase